MTKKPKDRNFFKLWSSNQDILVILIRSAFDTIDEDFQNLFKSLTKLKVYKLKAHKNIKAIK